jgi:hypothetical protein
MPLRTVAYMQLNERRRGIAEVRDVQMMDGWLDG